MSYQQETVGGGLLSGAPCVLYSGADLTGGHLCSGRRGPWEAGPWRPQASKAPEGSILACNNAIAKSWLQLELNLWSISI